MRSLGSSVGIAVVGWQVATRTQFHWTVLSAQMTPFNPQVHANLSPLGLQPQSVQGAEALANAVAAQASLLAFQDAFWLTGLAAFAMMPVVLILQRPTGSQRTVATH